MRQAAALISVLAWPNNLVTLGRMAGVSALVAAIALNWHISPVGGAAAFVLVYWASDYLDGWLARRLNKSSPFGETLDLVADRWCDILLAAFLIRHTPGHAPALISFLLLRIVPEVILGRFVGSKPGLFTTAATRFVSRQVSDRSMDIASASRTIFFAWALFGDPPAWLGLLVVVPAAIFACLAIRILADMAAESLSVRAQGR